MSAETNESTEHPACHHGHPIKVVEKRTGLTAHTIRVWEKRYKAVVPDRTPTNRRVYSDEDVERLQLLRKATLTGRSIGQVADLPTDELRDLIHEDEDAEVGSFPAPSGHSTSGHSNGRDATNFLEDALTAVGELDAPGLQCTLAHASLALSKPALMEELIVPLMYRIGDMWREGSVRVAHEHLASVVVRNFLGSLEPPVEVSASAPVIVVATPAGQMHELGALIVAATAASEGWRVVHLGPNLPYDEIASAVHQAKARVVALSIVYPADDPNVNLELQKLRQMLPADVAILVGGRAAGSYQESCKAIGAAKLKDMISLRAVLESLRAS